MGLVSITCANCEGKGLITVEQYGGLMLAFKKKTCDDCEGVGSYLIHTGQIGSELQYSGANEDQWSRVWGIIDSDVPLELMFPDRH